MLPHVVNYELPNVPEDYVHRIGRTGRAGAQGEAISLVCPDENGFLRDIERLIKREIPKEIVEGFAPPVGEKAEPIVLGRMVIGEGAGRGGFRSGGGRSGGGGGGGGGGRGRNDGRSAPARAGGGGAPARSGAGGGGQAPRAPSRDGNAPQGNRAAPAARPAGPRPEPRREGGAMFAPRSTTPKR